MKILQVTPYFYPHLGGVESHVMSLSQELVKMGHEVTVATSLSGGAATHETYPNFEVFRVKPLFTAYNTPMMPGIKDIVARTDADIVHTHTPPPFTSYFAAKAAKKKRVPFVLTYHCDIEIPSRIGPALTGAYRVLFDSYVLNSAAMTIVTTKTYASTSRAVWGHEPAVVPSAVDAAMFNPNISGARIRRKYGLEGEKCVMYVGRLRHHKGIEYLIESARYAKDGIKYLIVGGGDHEVHLSKLIRRFGLGGKVIMAGAVPNSDLPEYYAACDVLALPSVSRLEAFGLVVLEAMASGKPVLVSDIPGVREVIENNSDGLLLEPFNAKDIAEKVNLLLGDEALCARLGANGRKKVEAQYQISTISKKIEEIYKEVLGSGQAQTISR